MKFDPNKIGSGAGRRQAHRLPARNVLLFSRVITGRRRRVDGADPLGFLSSQFGNRFDSGNTRLRAGERVYKQPGRSYRNTTFKSITELFMSFHSSQFAQYLRVFLDQLLSRPTVLTMESTKIERGILSQSPSRSPSQSQLQSSSHSSLLSLSLYNDRGELQCTSSSSSSSVLMSLQTYQLRARVAQSQAVTFNRRDLLSQLAQTVRTTAQQFQMQTFARLFAPARTHLATEKSSHSQLNVGYLNTLQKKIAGTIRQILVQAIRSHISVQKFSEAKLRPQREELRPLDRQAMSQVVQLIRQAWIRDAQSSGPERQAWTREAQLGWPDTHSSRPERWPLHAGREFHLVTSSSRVMTERVLLNLFRRHRERLQPIHVSQEPGSPIMFSSLARGRDLRRIEKTVSRLSSTETILAGQSTLETLINRSRSIGRFLRENNFFKTSRLKQFASHFRAIETDRSLPAISERILAMKESGMSVVPANGFVFAQPLRQEAAAEPVAKRVEAREVVEIVKKEVNQSLASAASLRNFTRQDYEEISERVYSSLVRRLTIERERLGFG